MPLLSRLGVAMLKLSVDFIGILKEVFDICVKGRMVVFEGSSVHDVLVLSKQPASDTPWRLLLQPHQPD
jgi:hypothetical protein